MSQQKNLSLALLLLGLPVLLLAGCRGEAENGKPAVAQLPTVSVTVGKAVEKTATRQVELMGSLQATEQAEIAAKLSGNIIALPVVLGSRVEKGDLLAEVNAGEINARQRQARAQLEQARRNLDRERNLLKKNAATPENVRALEDTLRIATAAWEEAGTMLEYTRILAPFSGVVTGKMASVGDLATPGKPLLQIENEARLQAITNIPESMIAGVKPGDQLQVFVPAADIRITGTVAEVAPTADRLSRTAQVKIDIPADPKLRSGQFARVTLASGGAVTITVPESALTTYGQMERVFVVAEGRARLRLVKSGARTDGEVEILSGLKAGETVVTDGSRQLADGQPVSVQ
jgi:RND family efflux transporter MFP subunit